MIRIVRFILLPELRLCRSEYGRRLWRGLCPAGGDVQYGDKTRSHTGHRVAGLVLILAGLLFALTGDLFAQTIDPGLFAIEDFDTRHVLGFLGTLTVMPEPAVLTNMLWLFNSGVLVLAGVLLLYQTVASTLDTAQSGRWSLGGWQIIRIVTAVALMAPLPGGFNGAQHIVLSLAHLGGDFAQVVWTPFTESVLKGGRPIGADQGETMRRSAIARALVVETCMFVANGSGETLVAVDRDQEGNRLTIRYGGTASDAPRNLCGAIEFDGLTMNRNDRTRTRGWQGVPKQDSENAIAVVKDLGEGHRIVFEGLLPEIRRLAAQLGKHYVPGAHYGDALPDADATLGSTAFAEDYRAGIETVLAHAAGDYENAMTQLGRHHVETASWLWAGSFFSTIAWQTGRLERAARNVPRVSLPGESLGKWSPRADAAVKSLVAWLAQSRWPPVLYSTAAGYGGGSHGGSARPDDIVSGLFEFVEIDATMIGSGENPVIELSRFGHGLIAAALSAMGLLIGAATGSNLLEGVPFVGSALDVFEAGWSVADAFVTLVLGVMLISGIVLAYLLPVLPFIRFLFGILTWLISVTEAILAITVFAAAHITREDSNSLIVQATRQGWLLLPGLVLRPVLMVFGLVFGYFVFLAGMEVLNALWAPQLQMAQGSGRLDPVGFLVMLALYTIVAWVLMNSAFKLIDLLPRKVLRWIGGSGDDPDDGSDSVGSVAAAGVGRVGHLRVGRLR